MSPSLRPNQQAYQFPVEPPYAGQEERCLHKALDDARSPLVRYLAFRDLTVLADSSPARRKRVFALSQPGTKAGTRCAEECLRGTISLFSR